MNYQTEKHSKYLLLYHLILVTKYRHPVLIKLGNNVKNYVKKLESKYNFSIETMEVDTDHIHLLIRTTPDINLKKLIVNVKKNITYNLYRESKEVENYLRRFYWFRNKVFSEGYFICTIGNVNEETIRKYIENQG